jgi:probable phosphomutase (TIGR03848 family)
MILLLVRHGMTDAVGRSIAGRAPGVHLNAQGSAEAAALAGCLARLPLVAVYSSPLERALETARPIAEGAGLPVRSHPGLIELDFGDWTGKTLDELSDDPRWGAFNARRGATRIPGGETMGETVARTRTAVADLRLAHGGRQVVAVSHGDVIRGLLADVLGLPLDHLFRLEVAPASVSAVDLAGHPARLLTLNWRPGQPL